ncbi:hypothetical protein KZZ07_09290 [Mameliella sp. CS4]|uniref:hypothetical protein n=1 Tax=Mameliella sp. CS4 TaxID=2862329 RepID=UPI001C5CFB5E|nr:hypothetical protein [Mameliella sp. CS4]MBW4982734.1 hypothetical protein [Mameliella sp. CS4]
MATDSYVSHLKERLAKNNADITRLEERLQSADEPDKARAIAQLVQCRQRHDTLAERIARAETEGADDWSALHESFRDEADAISDTLARWLNRLD